MGSGALHRVDREAARHYDTAIMQRMIRGAIVLVLVFGLGTTVGMLVERWRQDSLAKNPTICESSRLSLGRFEETVRTQRPAAMANKEFAENVERLQATIRRNC